MPLGSKFIKSILYPSQAKELYEKLNIDKTYSFENSISLHWNSYNTLYQTLIEKEENIKKQIIEGLNDDRTARIINNYMNNPMEEDKNDFILLFKEDFYKAL